jgi:hypothetical protein
VDGEGDRDDDRDEEVQLIGVDGGGVVSAMVCVWWLPNLVDADEAGVGELGG